MTIGELRAILAQAMDDLPVCFVARDAGVKIEVTAVVFDQRARYIPSDGIIEVGPIVLLGEPPK